MSDIDLLSDFLDLEPFAKQAKRHPRTVRRWLDQPDGLPYTKIGNRILIHVPTARQWLLGRMKFPNPRPAAAVTQMTHDSKAASPASSTSKRA